MRLVHWYPTLYSPPHHTNSRSSSRGELVFVSCRGWFFGPAGRSAPALDDVEREVGLEVRRAEGGLEVELQGQLMLQLLRRLRDRRRNGEGHVCGKPSQINETKTKRKRKRNETGELYSFRFGCWL